MSKVTENEKVSYFWIQMIKASWFEDPKIYFQYGTNEEIKIYRKKAGFNV